MQVFLSSNFFVVQGSSLEYIRASDDDDDTIVFSLDSAGQSVLKIDNTGNLTLKASLDQEVGHISLLKGTKRDGKFWVRLSNIEMLFIWHW